jgi:hypothetical protein
VTCRPDGHRIDVLPFAFRMGRMQWIAPAMLHAGLRPTGVDSTAGEHGSQTVAHVRSNTRALDGRVPIVAGGPTRATFVPQFARTARQLVAGIVSEKFVGISYMLAFSAPQLYGSDRV